MASRGESGASSPRPAGSRQDLEAQNLLPRSGQDEEINKEKREHMRHLQKEAFQLANYYFIFQGVIFTAFYNAPSHVKCEYRWVPFSLSFLAGILNLCALLTIACKYKSTLDDIDTNAMRGRRNFQGPSSESGARNDPTPAVGSGNRGDPIAVKCDRNWRIFCVVVCMSLFVGFFVVTLIGCRKITCGDKRGSAAVPPSAAN